MINLFKTKKEKEEAEKQYQELLKSVNAKPSKTEGFVLGEQKKIYDEDLSLDDILNNK